MNGSMIRHPMRARLVSLLLLSGLAMLISACGEEQQPQQVPEYDFTIEVNTLSTDDAPVPGVPVRLDGNVVGFTDADGTFKGVLRERPGEEIELAIDKVDGYHIDSDDMSKQATLQITRSLEGEYRGLPVNLRTEMRSTILEYLSWVGLSCDSRLDDEHCQNVPILLDGEEMARTDSAGFAHFVFDGIPGEEHELSVDMSASDSTTIEPSSPSYTIELERSATVFHINEEFTDPTVRRRPRPRPRPQPRPQPQPSEPDEDEGSSSGGAIPLF